MASCVVSACTVCGSKATFRAPFERESERKWFYFCKEVCFMIHTNSEWSVLLPAQVRNQVISEYRSHAEDCSKNAEKQDP